jgi:prepilin-type N-terminal cleavage/methylation domain-containing protein
MMSDDFRQMPARFRSDRGMTLVELIVVMAIFGVVVSAVYSLLIPVQQSTVAQTRVVDVQDNLRLVLDRMTKDLRMAGLLINGQPLRGDAVNTPPAATSFTIRTRSVQGVCARVAEIVANPGNYQVFPAEMAGAFVSGGPVRIYDALNPANSASGTVTINQGGTPGDYADDTLSFSFAPPDIDNPVFILVRLNSATDPDEQTITYRHEPADRSLRRVLNEGVAGQEHSQILATGISAVNFTYEFGDYGYYRQVNIMLEGKTRALKDDALSGEKTRRLNTSVTIRNAI